MERPANQSFILMTSSLKGPGKVASTTIAARIMRIAALLKLHGHPEQDGMGEFLGDSSDVEQCSWQSAKKIRKKNVSHRLIGKEEVVLSFRLHHSGALHAA